MRRYILNRKTFKLVRISHNEQEFCTRFFSVQRSYDAETANLQTIKEEFETLQTEIGELMSQVDIAMRKQEAVNQQLKMNNKTLRKELETSMWDNQVDRQFKIQFLKEKDQLNRKVALLNKQLYNIQNK